MDSSGQLHAPVALILERRLQYPMDERVGGVAKVYKYFLSLQGTWTRTPPTHLSEHSTTQNSDLKSCVVSGYFRFSNKTAACESHRI